jgi:hypothetical protein
VRLIREGKLKMPKVRVVGGVTIVEHDLALLPLVEKIGRYPMFANKRKEAANTLAGEGSVSSADGANMDSEADVSANGPELVSSTREEQRREYMRKFMEDRRKRRREGKDG